MTKLNKRTIPFFFCEIQKNVAENTRRPRTVG